MKNNKLIKRFFSKTPHWYIVAQAISAAIAALPKYYSDLPQAFQDAVPTSYIKYVTITGGLLIFILQFKTKKQ